MTLGLGNAFFRLTYCLDALTGRYAKRLALGGLGIRSMTNIDAIEANAHLIAAAPDLLMDMEDMAQWFASNGEIDGCFFDEATILGRIRETIAKARGRY